MIELLEVLSELFKGIHEESYLNQNNAEEVVYPYITYELASQNIDFHADGFFIDVDIFDLNSSYIGIYELEEELRKQLERKRLLHNSFLLRFNFERSNNVSTLDKKLKRRNIQFYVKTDWRNK